LPKSSAELQTPELVLLQAAPAAKPHPGLDEGAAPGALQQLSSFQAFVSGAEDRHEQPATFASPELVGDCGTFGDREL
jgi:hypothetical protein